MDAGDHDDQAIARVRRLADKPRVVCRLAALHVTHDHATSAPVRHVTRIAEPVENLVRHLIGCPHDGRRQPVLRQQSTIPIPVMWFDQPARLRIAKPGLEVDSVDDGTQPHTDAVLFLE